MTLKAVTGVARTNKKGLAKPQPFLLKQKRVNILNLIFSLWRLQSQKSENVRQKIHN